MTRLFIALARVGDGLLVYLLICVVLALILASRTFGDEPPVAWSAGPPVAYTTPAPPVAVPERDTLRASDGLLYQKHPDGIYRPVPGQKATPEVVAPTPFRSAYNPSHRCEVCGRTQYTIAGPGPLPGTHRHVCAAGHSWWH